MYIVHSFERVCPARVWREFRLQGPVDEMTCVPRAGADARSSLVARRPCLAEGVWLDAEAVAASLARGALHDAPSHGPRLPAAREGVGEGGPLRGRGPLACQGTSTVWGAAVARWA